MAKGPKLNYAQAARARTAARKERKWRAQYDQYLEATGQLNYQQPGYSPGGVASTPAPVPTTPPVASVTGSNDYVVTDTDTVATIADKTGTTPEDILSYNPDVPKFKTGLSIKVPNSRAATMINDNLPAPVPAAAAPPAVGGPAVGSEQFRLQKTGGLPSNAAQGQLTTNPQGVNAGMLAYSQSISQQSVSRDVVGRGGANPFSSYEYKQPGTSVFQQGNIPGSSRRIGPFGQGEFSQQALAFNGQPLNAETDSSYQPNANDPETKRNLFMEYAPTGAQQFRNVIQNGLTPTADMLQWGVQKGWINPPNQGGDPSYYGSGGGGGGGYGYGGGGGGFGGGGGGGKKNASGNYPAKNQPQFSSAAGFRGLVNWRI